MEVDLWRKTLASVAASITVSLVILGFVALAGWNAILRLENERDNASISESRRALADFRVAVSDINPGSGPSRPLPSLAARKELISTIRAGRADPTAVADTLLTLMAVNDEEIAKANLATGSSYQNAVESLLAAIQSFEELQRRHPEEGTYIIRQAECYEGLGGVEIKAGYKGDLSTLLTNWSKPKLFDFANFGLIVNTEAAERALHVGMSGA